MKRPPLYQLLRSFARALRKIEARAIIRDAVQLPFLAIKAVFQIHQFARITRADPFARKFVKNEIREFTRRDRRAWAKVGINLDRLTNDEFRHVAACKIRGQIRPMPQKEGSKP